MSAPGDIALPDQASLPPHYESRISFSRDRSGRLLVTKTYKREHECISWLNSVLAGHYDPSAGLPVAQHEYAAYEALEPLGFVPRPVELRPDSIVVEYGGAPLAADSLIADGDYERQCRRVLESFRSIGFRHNDLLPGNVLISSGKVRIIDFTLAEFGAVELTGSLPNPDWARAGRDEDLLGFLREARAEAEAQRPSSGISARVRRLLGGRGSLAR